MTEHNRGKGVMEKDKRNPKSDSGHPMKDPTKDPMKDPMKDKQDKDSGQKVPGGPGQHGHGERGERSDKESIGRPVQLDGDRCEREPARIQQEDEPGHITAGHDASGPRE